MATVKDIQVIVCSDPAKPGHEVGHYQEEPVRRGVTYVEVFPGMSLCLQLEVSSDFDWSGANALMVRLHPTIHWPLVALPVMRPEDGSALTIDFDKWPIWSGEEWQDATFRFAKLSAMEYRDANNASSEAMQIRVEVFRAHILEFDHDHTAFENKAERIELYPPSSTRNQTLRSDTGLRVVADMYPFSYQGRHPSIARPCSASKGTRFNFYIKYRMRGAIERYNASLESFDIPSTTPDPELSIYRHAESTTITNPLLRFEGYALSPDIQHAMSMEIHLEHARHGTSADFSTASLQEPTQTVEPYQLDSSGYIIHRASKQHTSNTINTSSQTTDTNTLIGNDIGSNDDDVVWLETKPMAAPRENWPAYIKTEFGIPGHQTLKRPAFSEVTEKQKRLTRLKLIHAQKALEVSQLELECEKLEAQDSGGIYESHQIIKDEFIKVEGTVDNLCVDKDRQE